MAEKTFGKKVVHLLSRNILSTAAVLSLMGIAAFAAAPTGGYAPGETLDPQCAPGEANCFVKAVVAETDPLRKFVEGSGGVNAVYTGGKVGIGTDSPEKLFSIEKTYQQEGGDAMISKKMVIDNTVSHNEYYHGDISALETSENNNLNVRGLVAKQNVTTKNGDGNVFYGGALQNVTNVNNAGRWRYLSGVSSYITFSDTASNESLSSFSAPLTFRGDSQSTSSISSFSSGINVNDNATVAKFHGISVGVKQNSSNSLGNVYGLKLNMSGVGIIENSYGVYLDDSPATNSYGIYQLGSDDTNYFEGNIGIGTTDPKQKLEVNGGIKVGNVATCDADAEGTIKYNAGQFQGCNGTIWINLH